MTFATTDGRASATFETTSDWRAMASAFPRRLPAEADSSLVLSFPHVDCEIWCSRKQFRPAPANCMYLAEQRFGDGDGVFTVVQQSRAINAPYDVVRGAQAHTVARRG